jgi:hypothetical protein
MSYEKNEVGKNAGLVWRFLQKNGPTNLSTLKEATELSRTQLLLAIGWLLREEKLINPETNSRAVLFEAI